MSIGRSKRGGPKALMIHLMSWANVTKIKQLAVPSMAIYGLAGCKKWRRHKIVLRRYGVPAQ